MNRDEFIKEVRAFYLEGLDILKEKNSDYAPHHDPWRNFRFASIVGVNPVKAQLVRISEKLARTNNLIDKLAKNETASVKDETIEDSLLDLANYSAILAIYLQQQWEREE